MAELRRGVISRCSRSAWGWLLVFGLAPRNKRRTASRHGGQVLVAMRAGDLLSASRHAGVSSHYPASCSMARAEMALNQDKNRLQLRRRSGSPEHSRSFKFTACAVSENLSGTLSPRSSAIVPGRRAGSPVLRGLKVGEIMSVLRDRSPPREGESMAWPHRRGDESLILASAAYPRRSRSASPPPRVRPGPGPDDEARLAAMFAAVSAEEEAEVDILKLGGVNPDGRTRPLSPRVPGSDWQEGLSTRMAERGGSRLFPTHLAKSAPASASRAPAGMKPGGVFVPGGSPKAKAKAPQAPSLAAEAPSRIARVKPQGPSAPVRRMPRGTTQAQACLGVGCVTTVSLPMAFGSLIQMELAGMMLWHA
eukprot:g2667.t1